MVAHRPKEFEERTGIWVDVVTGGTNELLQPHRPGGGRTRQADVMFGGGVDSLHAYRDRFEPYTTTQSSAIAQHYRAPRTCGPPSPPCPWYSSTTPSSSPPER